MRQYEMTYLISDKIGENDLTAATGKINGLITTRKGKVLGEDNWGRRKLAYPIQKQEFATYVTLNFELEPEELKKLSRDLKLSKEIVRFLIIVKDYGKETLKLTADEVAETEEIEEVVGGERSFEAVEGETEESYDLMAKREEDKDIDVEATQSDTDEDTVKTEETMGEAVEEAVEAEKETKTAKKTSEKAEAAKTTDEEKKEVAKEVKPAKKKAEKKSEEKAEVEDKKAGEEVKDEVETEPSKTEKEMKAEAEADRLAKLDEEIEGILGDDL